ncbi:hypothetical protein FA95DRAFT_1575067 [Auriscalpium vulgare]|uniref:Uncharacterized protein n=1 Tax=Auriscalpium vulgare TaxID=40419 RepID=A0ACB8RIP0_9AGAM|nr:hypothetical protein FA95DRAFT_1575067 [Auriscalpium vulgare]
MAIDPQPFIIPLAPCALPPSPALFHDIRLTDDHKRAYATARMLEALTAWPGPTPSWRRPVFTPTIAGRVLGQLLCEVPGVQGVDGVAREINGCTRPDDVETLRALADLAAYYMDCLLEPFLQDAYFVEEEGKAADGGLYTTSIVPHELGVYARQGSDRTQLVWDILERRNECNVGGEEQLKCSQNKIPLIYMAHKMFQKMDIWFTAVEGSPDTYTLESRIPNDLFAVMEENPVTFRSKDPARLPLPDPLYISFHRAVARVLHLSGAGQYITLQLSLRRARELSGITERLGTRLDHRDDLEAQAVALKLLRMLGMVAEPE